MPKTPLGAQNPPQTTNSNAHPLNLNRRSAADKEFLFLKKHGKFSMRNIFLNRKLRQKAGCRIELPVVSNHLGGISPGENCPGVIVCGYFTRGYFSGGAITWGQFLFQITTLKFTNYQRNDTLKHVFPISFLHFYINIDKDEGRTGNIFQITRKQPSKGTLQNKCI